MGFDTLDGLLLRGLYFGWIATTGCGTWDRVSTRCGTWNRLVLLGVVRGMDCYYGVWYAGQIVTTGCGTLDRLLLLGVVRGMDCYYGVWYAGQIVTRGVVFGTVVCRCTILLHLSRTFSVDERLLKT